MGQKVHPHGFRLGVIYDWESKWFAKGKEYKDLLEKDRALRNFIDTNLPDASISRIEIDRNANLITVTIRTSRPGVVIGRQGTRVEELRGDLEKLTGGRIRVNIQEIRTPELDALLVARSVSEQLTRRVAYRRAVKQAVQRTMQRGAQGIRISVSGRLGGAEMSRSETQTDGRVPRHTLRADIDYGLAEAHTTFGRIGVKTWIYKGDLMPEDVEAQQPSTDLFEDEEPDTNEVETATVEPEDSGQVTISIEQQEAVARASANNEGDDA